MKKVPFLTLVLGLISMTALAQTRPNILYFYVDDMGYGSIGPNGQDTRRANNLPAVQTPHIDSIAAAGINFQRAYGAPVCSPARSSQQTGYHQGHTYADRNDPDNARKAMRADDLTMGKALKAAGYVTGYWGKWGYGAESDQNNPAILNEQTLPNNHGYDYVLAELHHVRAHTFFQPTLWKYEPGDSQIQLVPNSMAAYTDPAQYPQSPANQNDPAYPSTAYCDDVYAMHCLDFVRAAGAELQQHRHPVFRSLRAADSPRSFRRGQRTSGLRRCLCQRPALERAPNPIQAMGRHGHPHRCPHRQHPGRARGSEW
jgi:hypothetical protein